MHRRRFLQNTLLGAGAGLLTFPSWAQPSKLASAIRSESLASTVFHPPMMVFPEKKPLLMHSDSPPLLEASRGVFTRAVTPNDEFFVRWHHAVIPDTIDLRTYRLSVSGNVENPLELTVDQLRTQFEAIEYHAVKQCGGNSRSNFSPVTSGIQWHHGAMGSAHWKGVRLRDVLAAAKIKPNSEFIKLNGLERPVLRGTPAFERKLDKEEFGRDDVMIAYEMNGTEIPLLNGFPLILVVPGYFADNWVKMIERIEVLEKDEPVFYTDNAYRLPAANPFDSVPPGDPMPEKTRPLKKLKIKSVIAAPAERNTFTTSDRVTMSGVAFDGGFGIKEVLVSVDNGETWTSATLGEDLGRYAFRAWSYTFNPKKKGQITLMSRAVNRLGETQPLPQNIDWNPAGYQWNAADTLVIQVA